MANSANAIGQFTDEVEQATGEVAEGVKDAFGEMIEQGVQAVKGTPTLTPQQIQQKQQEEEKQKAEVRRKLKFHEITQATLNKQYKLSAEKEKQRKELLLQEEENKKRLEQENKARIISPAKIAPPIPGQPAPVVEEIARSKQESGKGHGIGG